MPAVIKFLHRLGAGTSTPPTAGKEAGELAINFPTPGVGVDPTPELHAFDGAAWRRVDPRDKLNRTGDIIANYGEAAFNLGAALNGAVNVDISNGIVQFGTLSADATFTFVNPSNHPATSFSLLITLGGFTPSFPDCTGSWVGSEPDWSGTAYLLAFFHINGQWYGSGDFVA